VAVAGLLRYLDTTYGQPCYQFPPQAVSVAYVIRVCSHPAPRAAGPAEAQPPLL
jgi:hypothetical protein